MNRIPLAEFLEPKGRTIGHFVADVERGDSAALELLARYREVQAEPLEFLILTNVRTDTVLKAQKAELTLDEALWTVPLLHLKDRKHRKQPFRVPLCPRAIAPAKPRANIARSRLPAVPARAVGGVVGVERNLREPAVAPEARWGMR
jgi:hypothetical protein